MTATGLVTAVSVGTTNIVATSEGRSGQVTFTVRSPIASVTVSGSSRVKVGDLYTYTTIARAADGSIVDRPVVWGVRESGRALVTQSGALTPLQPGSFTLVARIDGEDWVTTPTAYDWASFASSGRGFLTIESDLQVANRFGRSDYTSFTIACGGTGPFFVWITIPHMITASGLVTYGFDGGSLVSETWQELSPSFNTLWHPSSGSGARAYAQRVALARRFTIAWSEFNASARATQYRVTGLAERLPAHLTTYCPTVLRAEGQSAPAGDNSIEDQRREVTALFAARRAGQSVAPLHPDAREREMRGPASSSSPLLNAWPTWSTPPQMLARRERR